MCPRGGLVLSHRRVGRRPVPRNSKPCRCGTRTGSVGRWRWESHHSELRWRRAQRPWRKRSRARRRSRRLPWLGLRDQSRRGRRRRRRIGCPILRCLWCLWCCLGILGLRRRVACLALHGRCRVRRHCRRDRIRGCRRVCVVDRGCRWLGGSLIEWWRCGFRRR